ncbi:MAG: anti-anti-sigma factor [Bacteroidetes bacterium]|nr:MAG: anti-anti-sigma factor [Bacteroidota bacterium]
MRVKIDTREKFHAITILEDNLAANMTADMDKSLSGLLQNDVKNVILNLKDIHSIDNAAAEKLVRIQQAFYENNASFVIFGMNPIVEKTLDESDLLSMMNVAPTESEASDIVKMEMIERELLDEGLE